MRAKLTEADVVAIRQSSEPRKVLMERYGICAKALKNIRSGRSWRNVDPPRAIAPSKSPKLVCKRCFKTFRQLHYKGKARQYCDHCKALRASELKTIALFAGKDEGDRSPA